MLEIPFSISWLLIRISLSPVDDFYSIEMLILNKPDNILNNWLFFEVDAIYQVAAMPDLLDTIVAKPLYRPLCDGSQWLSPLLKRWNNLVADWALDKVLKSYIHKENVAKKRLLWKSEVEQFENENQSSIEKKKKKADRC
jgi:hypothetical protein